MTTVFNNNKKLKRATNVSTSSVTTQIAEATANSVTLDTKYLNTSGDKMNGVLEIDPYLRFQDGSEQSTAYTTIKDQTMQTIYNNTIGLEMVNDVLNINKPVNLTDGITLQPNDLEIMHITGLQNQINTYDTDILNLQTDKSDITYVDTQLNFKNNVIDANNLLESNLINTSGDILLSDYITNNNSNITNLENDKANITYVDTQLSLKQNNISESNKLSTDLIETLNNMTLSIYITDNDTNISTLQNTKADNSVVDAITNKLINLSFTDGTTIITNATQFSDSTINNLIVENNLTINGSCSISNLNYELTDQQFSYLSTIESDYQTTINNIKSDVSGNQTDIIGISGNLSQLTLDVNGISGDLTQLTNDVSGISGNLTQAITDISTNTSDIGEQLGYIGDLQGRMLTAENDIISNTNAIGTKQNIINSNNRLSSEVIADGSITNAMFQSLYNIKTNESIQHQIDTITTNKQDKITLSNKLSSDYIQYQTDDLTETLDSLASRIQGVENFNSNISNLDVLRDIDFNNISDLVLSKASIEYVDNAVSNLTNNTYITEQLNLKQNVINASNKLNADYIQTAYGIDGNMTLSNALTDIRSGLDYNLGAIIDMNNTKQINIDEQNKISYHFIETKAGNDLAELFVDDENNIKGANVRTNFGENAILNDALTIIQNNINNNNDSVNNALNLKLSTSDFDTYVQNNDTNLTNLLSEKSDITYVDGQLGQKQNIINNSNLVNSQYIDVGNDNTLYDYIISNGNTINTINQNIALKQNIINASNKLSTTVINHNHNDVNTTLNTKLINIDSSVDDIYSKISNVPQISSDVSDLLTLTDTLNNYKTSLTDTIIPGIQQDIQELNDNKQNNIDINNLLESGYISTGVNENLHDKLISIDSNISSKQNNITTSSRLESDKISTYVNNSNGVLSNILQNLTDINTNQSTAIQENNDYIDAQKLRIDGHGIRLDVVEENIGLLQGADQTHDLRMNGIDDAIDLKQDIINSSNKLSSDYISTNVNNINSTLSSVLQSHEDLIDALDTDKQDLINNTTNKLNYDCINFTGSNWSNLDYTSSINSKFAQLDSQIQTITGFNDFTTFDNINIDLNALDAAIEDLQNTKQNVIDANNKLDGAFVKYNNSLSIIQKIDSINSGGGSSIPSISYDSNVLETTISDRTIIGTDIKFSDNSVQSTGFTSAKNTDLSNCKTKLTDISYNNNTTTIANNLVCNNITGATIDDIYNDIGTKQDIINNTTNKLTYDKIDFTGSNIQYADYGSSINSKFTALDNSISTLSNNDSAQITTNTNLANGISGLTSSKQDVLSASNKLNSAYLACSGLGEMSNTKMQYLSSISGDIQEQLSLKQDAISNISNLAYVDINSNLTTLLSNKQNAIADGDLTIAKTSGLQTALNSKWNTPSNESNLTYVDINSSLQTILNNKASVSSLNSKQETINASNKLDSSYLNSGTGTMSNLKMQYLSSISSDIQTQLSAKANINGNTYTGTHDFTSATVSGISSTISDNSLTIAKTNGLQSALDSKLNDMVFIMAIQPMYNVTSSYTSSFSGGSATSAFIQNAWTITSGNQTAAWSFIVQIDNSKLVHGCKYVCLFNTLMDSNFTTATTAKATLSIDSGVGSPTVYTARFRQDQSFRPSGITLLTGFSQSSLQGVTHTPTMFNFVADTTNGTYIKIFCDTKGTATYFNVNFGTFMLYKMN